MGKFSPEEAWNVCLSRREEDESYQEKSIEEWGKAFKSALEKLRVQKKNIGNFDELFPIESSFKLSEEELSDQVWLVKNIIPAASLIEIHGSKGSYKSFVSVDLAYCLAEKVPFLGNFDFEIKENNKVL